MKDLLKLNRVNEKTLSRVTGSQNSASGNESQCGVKTMEIVTGFRSYGILKIEKIKIDTCTGYRVS